MSHSGSDLILSIISNEKQPTGTILDQCLASKRQIKTAGGIYIDFKVNDPAFSLEFPLARNAYISNSTCSCCNFEFSKIKRTHHW